MERRRDRTLGRAAGIGLGVGVYGVSFGVLAVAAGMSTAQACVMSMLVFTGASQFAFVGVLAAGGGAVAAMGPAVMLALRNAVYGLSLAVPADRRDDQETSAVLADRRDDQGTSAVLADRRDDQETSAVLADRRDDQETSAVLAGRLRDRALAAHLVIDETTAMARAQDDPAEARRAFLLTGVSVWLCWNAGTLIGALVGGGLDDPRALGLDAMFPAAFLALLAPQLRRTGAPAAAIAGAVVALVLLPYAPTGVPVIAALAGVVPGVLLARAARPGPSGAACPPGGADRVPEVRA